MSRCPEPGSWAAFDTIERAARLALAEHARGCPACRDRLVADDPSRLFSLLALRPVPPAALARVSAAVTAGLDVEPARTVRSARRAAISGWAAAALLAIAAARMLLSPHGVPAPGRTPGDDPAELAFTASAAAGARAGVELLAAPGAARVVDLAVGETQVVMIFDERLDL